MQREILVSFREDLKNVQALDKIADALGVDRSGISRILVREKLKFEADTVLERYQRYK